MCAVLVLSALTVQSAHAQFVQRKPEAKPQIMPAPVVNPPQYQPQYQPQPQPQPQYQYQPQYQPVYVPQTPGYPWVQSGQVLGQTAMQAI